MSVLEYRGVSVPGSEQARLDQLSLKVQRGDCVMLLGPNGAGKSTLLRCALGLERFSGEVLLEGQPTQNLTAQARAGLLSWLPQRLEAREPLSAQEVVAIARHRFKESHSVAMQHAEATLRRLGVGPLAARRLTELSGGEQQRVYVAALVAQEAPLLLLDEPANHLDPSQQLGVYGLLRDLWNGGLTLMCATHDVNLLQELTPHERVRVVGIKHGKLLFDRPLVAPDLSEALGELFEIPFQRLETSNSDPKRFYFMPLRYRSPTEAPRP